MKSTTSVTEAVRGADYAYYLVHSMSPSSGLTQADFDDLDLLLADNFVRAADAASVSNGVSAGSSWPTPRESTLLWSKRVKNDRSAS